jgi:hypothetical protein
MDDDDVRDRIEQLVAEEQKLLAASGGDGLDEDQHRRLEELRVSLDRYWDLLRQRRAHEEAGLNPDEASLRSADTVEHYEQ